MSFWSVMSVMWMTISLITMALAADATQVGIALLIGLVCEATYDILKAIDRGHPTPPKPEKPTRN